MTKWEAEYPFYHYLRAGPFEATVAEDKDGAKAYIVGNVDEARGPFATVKAAEECCKSELRKIRDKINEALEEE